MCERKRVRAHVCLPLRPKESKRVTKADSDSLSARKSERRKDGGVIALGSQRKEGGEFTATITFLGRVLEG